MAKGKPMISESDLKISSSLERIKHVIIVISGKGGVGKSTVSSNIAMTLAMKKFKTGLMDVDIHGPNIPKMLGLEDAPLGIEDGKLVPVIAANGLKVMSMAFLLPERDAPVAWRGPVKMGAIRQFIEDVAWDDLDYLVIDMPPGTGDEALSVVQLIPKADGMIVVTTPQDVALLDSRKSIVFSVTVNIPVIGLIENMSGFVCPHCNERVDIFKTGGGEATATEMGVQFLGRIPIETNIVAGGDSGVPIVISSPDSGSAKAFADITEKVIRTIG